MERTNAELQVGDWYGPLNGRICLRVVAIELDGDTVDLTWDNGHRLYRRRMPASIRVKVGERWG